MHVRAPEIISQQMRHGSLPSNILIVLDGNQIIMDELSLQAINETNCSKETWKDIHKICVVFQIGFGSTVFLWHVLQQRMASFCYKHYQFTVPVNIWIFIKNITIGIPQTTLTLFNSVNNN